MCELSALREARDPGLIPGAADIFKTVITRFVLPNCACAQCYSEAHACKGIALQDGNMPDGLLFQQEAPKLKLGVRVIKNPYQVPRHWAPYGTARYVVQALGVNPAFEACPSFLRTWKRPGNHRLAEPWRVYVAWGRVLHAVYLVGDGPPPTLNIAWPGDFCGAVDFGTDDLHEIRLRRAYPPYGMAWRGATGDFGLFIEYTLAGWAWLRC